MSRTARPLAIVLVALTLAGCLGLISDAATRVRYAMLDAVDDLGTSVGSTVSFTVDPDRWPDGCGGKGYTLSLVPYRGGKAVAVGDINVRCADGRPYGTGFGSEDITLAAELSVTKGPGETLTITLERTATGIAIVGLK
jgi:archaellum component FlaG (FlaF/FlaG flagellin family)